MCGYKSYHPFHTGRRFTLRLHLILLFTYIQEFADIYIEAQQLSSPQPVIIVSGSVEQPRKAFLACEKKIMSEVHGDNAALVLFATYYAFNMQYPHGCINVFSFLEVLFLNATPPKRTKLHQVLNMFKKHV